MTKFYTITYEDEPSGLSLVSIKPYSDYIDVMFYNGELFRDVHLGDAGKFMLDIWLEDDGSFKIESKFKYQGWREVDI